MAFIIPVMRLDTGAWFLGSPCMPRIALIAATPASRAPSSSSPQPAIAITLNICRQSTCGNHQVARHPPVFSPSWCGTINSHFSPRGSISLPVSGTWYVILVGTRCFFFYTSVSSAFKMVHVFEWFLRMAFGRANVSDKVDEGRAYGTPFTPAVPLFGAGVSFREVSSADKPPQNSIGFFFPRVIYMPLWVECSLRRFQSLPSFGYKYPFLRSFFCQTYRFPPCRRSRTHELRREGTKDTRASKLAM